VVGLPILLEFAFPKLVQDILTSYDDSVSSNIAAFIVDLFEAGVLIETLPSNISFEGDSARVCRDFIEPLADGVYRLAADLRALSPNELGEFLREHGYTVEGALGEICAQVTQLETNLVNIKKAAKPPAFEEDCDLKLNIGARDTCIEGWTNIDVYPADICCNIARGLPFESNSVRYAYMAHVLEHFFYPTEVLDVLCEVHRVLRPDGWLRVVVPDIRKYVFAYINKRQSVFSDRNAHFGLFANGETMLEQLLVYAGAGPAPGYLLSSHKFGYDFETLERLLSKAGFSSVTESTYMGSTAPVLRVDDASYVASARSGESHLSLFVDARV
jgi:SAM-dependent methyltransferase